MRRLLWLFLLLAMSACGAPSAADIHVAISQTQEAAPPRPTQTAWVIVITATTPPATSTPEATATPPLIGSIVNAGNLRSKPWVGSDTVMGQVGADDEFIFLERYEHDGDTWYRVRFTSGAHPGWEGWLSSFLTSSPESEDMLMTSQIPPPTITKTPRPATAKPTTARPRAPTARPPSGGRTGAICRDGTRSSATGRGACSHHGGVDHWLYD